jgi:hypothetical protein
MMTHAQAAAVVAQAAPDASFNEREAVRKIGFHESSYGAGWKGAGVGSNNWGAMQAPAGYKGPYFITGDSHASGQKYQGHFKKYATIVDGARDVWNWIKTKPDVRAAANSGSTAALAAAMHKHGYFEGFSTNPSVAIAQYAAALDRAGTSGPVPGVPQIQAPLPGPLPPMVPPSVVAASRLPAWMQRRG